MKLKALPFALLAVAVAGCGSSSGEESAPTQQQPPAAVAAHVLPKPTVNLKVVDSGSGFKVAVALNHFQIAPKLVGQAPVPGKGHLHFMLDGGKFDYPRYSGPNGALAKKLGVAGSYSPAVMPEIAYSHLPPGRYTLICMLANNNHTPTGVEAKQTIVVR
jgi:hypothetical protein